MSILLSQQIPEVYDPKDEQSLKDYTIAIKLAIEELARKAQCMQMEIRTDAPGANDLSESDMVRATVGGLNYIYTKYNGNILRFQLT